MQRWPRECGGVVAANAAVAAVCGGVVAASAAFHDVLDERLHASCHSFEAFRLSGPLLLELFVGLKM